MNKFNVLAINAEKEVVIGGAADLISACRESMSQNRPPYNTLFIVEETSTGSRFSIAEQEQLLKQAA